MIRKKGNEHLLQPLRIAKVDSNGNSNLTEVMAQLVVEQRESNRLLRKMAGQNQRSNSNSKISVFSSPQKKLGDSIVNDLQFGKENSPRKQYVGPEFQDRNSFAHSNFSPKLDSSPNNRSIITEGSHLGCCCERNNSTKNDDDLKDILKKIEKHLSKPNKEPKLIKPKMVNENGIQTDIPVHPPAPIDPIVPPVQMASSMGFSLNKTPINAKKQSIEAEQAFNIFDQKSVSKKRIDFNILSEFNKKNKVRKDSKSHSIAQGYDKYAQQEPKTASNLKPDKEVEQKKNYSILSQILPYSDRREIKVKMSTEDIIDYYKSRGEEIDLSKITEEWLGMVFRATASICWNMLSNNLLTFDETKILFTENIIFNFIECMKTSKELGYESNRVQLVENINQTAVSILDFLCTQYPQTKVQDPNIALRAEIPAIDNKGRVKFDFMGKVCKNKVVSLKKKKNGDYTPQIMQVINHMIEKTNEEFDEFNQLMNGLFGEVFLPIQKRRLEDTGQETHEDQTYFQKVKSYTKYAIGRKINKNTPTYSEPEIQNGIFFAKSPAVLRIITKWVQELDEMVRHPEIQIKNASKEFKDHDGLPMHLYSQIKNAINKAIKQNRQSLNEKIRCIKRECYNLEILLTRDKFTTDPTQIHLSEEQISVGKYCTYLKSAIASYICSQLNQLIDFLLDTPSNVDQTSIGISDPYFQEQTRKDLDNLNLVNFKIFDLLRCKCSSKQSEIIYLMRRLNDKSNDPDDPFKIVRIKDRLSSGTRDILVNAQIGKGLVCQIQLGVTSNLEKKQELLDQYNHFLYELKRAKLGSITESASIWSALEQRSKFFEPELKKQGNPTIGLGQKAHPCITDFNKSQNRRIIEFSRPIICASCQNFFQIPNTCLSNIKCQDCNVTYCGECHYEHLSENDRKEFVFEKKLFKCLLPHLKEYTDINKPFPQFGFIIRKKYLKKQLFYYRVNQNNNNETEKQEQVIIQLVISGIENGEVVNKTINKKELDAKIIDGKIYLNETYQKDMRDFLIYEIHENVNVERITMPYKDLLDNFTEKKLKFVNLLKHPTYIDDVKLLKKTKIIKNQISSFSHILSPDTLITYLKVYKVVFILQIEVDKQVLRQELIKLINLQRLKNFALEKCTSVSMEFREVTDQMDLISAKLPPYLLNSFSKRVTKLYLNYDMVKDIQFLSILPNLKVLFIRNNFVKSLEGIQELKDLIILCFDNNQVSDLKPLAGLSQLTHLTGIGNKIETMEGIQGLTKIKKLNFFDNKIKKMGELDKMTQIKELSLNFNPIEVPENIFHLVDLQELNLGKTNIITFEPLSVFMNLKKLSLNDLNLKYIGPVFKQFDFLIKLNLSGNKIQKIQNLHQMTELTELNLRNNKIKRIEGLQNCSKLEYIKISFNHITDIRGIKNLDSLKILKIVNNPLNDCSDFHLMNKKHFKLIFTKPGQAPCPEQQPTSNFYERYNDVIEHKHSSSSGSNGSSSNDQS